MADIDELIKKAMKDRNSSLLAGYRAVKSKMMVEKTSPKPLPLSAEQLFLKMVQKEIKERQETNSYYGADAGSKVVAENELIIKGLASHLPQKLSPAEQEKIVTEAIAKTKAKTMKDLSSVMAELGKKRDLIDMGYAAKLTKQRLQ